MRHAPSRAVALFGTEEKVTPRKTLRAGPLTCELDGGNLRYVRIGGKEALRAIAFIVRGSPCPPASRRVMVLR